MDKSTARNQILDLLSLAPDGDDKVGSNSARRELQAIADGLAEAALNTTQHKVASEAQQGALEALQQMIEQVIAISESKLPHAEPGDKLYDVAEGEIYVAKSILKVVEAHIAEAALASPVAERRCDKFTECKHLPDGTCDHHGEIDNQGIGHPGKFSTPQAREPVGLTVADYEERNEEVKRLTKEIGDLVFDYPQPEQPALVDIIGYLRQQQPPTEDASSEPVCEHEWGEIEMKFFPSDNETFDIRRCQKCPVSQRRATWLKVFTKPPTTESEPTE